MDVCHQIGSAIYLKYVSVAILPCFLIGFYVNKIYYLFFAYVFIEQNIYFTPSLSHKDVFVFIEGF